MTARRRCTTSPLGLLHFESLLFLLISHLRYYFRNFYLMESAQNK